MEVLRDAALEDELSTLASGTQDMMHTSWLDSLMGEEYGRIYAWGNKPSALGDYADASPCIMSDLPQSYLEPVLARKAQELGVEIRFGHQVESLVDEGDTVKLSVLDRKENFVYSIDSTYVIGADGARSVVVQQLGLPIVGQQLNNAFNVHIKADLTRFFKNRPGSLNWVLNVEAKDWSSAGNFRMVRPWTEFVVSMHPSLQPGMAEREPSMDEIHERLHQLIGDANLPAKEQIEIQVQSAYRWTINDQHATSWQKGRVLCIGDAVHRHPPINGLGSNTCISDAFNLAWKLAYVVRGIAVPAILDTLSQERVAVGQSIVARANDGMRAHRHLWSLLGLSKEERKRCLFLMSQANDEGAQQRLEVRKAMEATDDEVQALGMQMNQFYHDCQSRLVIQDKSSSLFKIPQVTTRDVPLSQHTLKKVITTTAPGFHLPHAWLAKDGQSPRVSTLDLCGKGKFCLLTGVGGQLWLDSIGNLSQKIPVTGFSIGFRQDYLDLYNTWANVREVSEDGAVLVRPDHFVAWRANSLHGVGNVTSLLEGVFASLLL
jgi:2-polyprenyl-6-methoxyphenol hydroxylase-like FAD-dependent oxidoreductase